MAEPREQGAAASAWRERSCLIHAHEPVLTKQACPSRLRPALSREPEQEVIRPVFRLYVVVGFEQSDQTVGIVGAQDSADLHGS